ncbi:C-C motif chemokine 8-like [Limanda limanda]|uniref:C-C motif chemokine 8-like n=1 Tax=Limanda limanda TaxID=27771 RepID=UPI0029C778E3|nr:C-C motif chemokine 8-like [Limanda limanda]
MKTPCFTLGLLLLLTVCCCDAMPQNCCFAFSNTRVPLKRLTSITKTNISCPTQAFIIQTVAGLKFCASQTSPWALDIYNRCIRGGATVEAERCIFV